MERMLYVLLATIVAAVITLAGIFGVVVLITKLLAYKDSRIPLSARIPMAIYGDPNDPKNLKKAITTCQILRIFTIIPAVIVTLLKFDPIVQLGFWVLFWGIGIMAGGVTVNALRKRKFELENNQ